MSEPTSSEPSQTTQTGRVSVRRVARGSKSEQTSVVLTTGERAWLLRRAGRRAFGPDHGLAALEGRTVTVTGYAGSGAFVVTADPQVHD